MTKNIYAEVITIGDEILYGQITDTNTQFISEELTKTGIKTIRKSSVGDQGEAILQILSEATQRADLIIITGGLGPTKDDITKTYLCKFFNTPLVVHQPTLLQVTEFFKKRDREMTDLNRKQAEVPGNCEVLINSLGTAPGMWIENKGKIYISMPGVPFEMKAIMTQQALPKIKEYFITPIIIHKMVHTIGIGESFLADKIEPWENELPASVKLAYLPSMGIVKLRLTAVGDNSDTMLNELDKQIKSLDELIAPFIFGYDEDSKIEMIIGRMLLSSHKTLAIAESCTGGYLAHLVTSIQGSSAYFKGGVISYANDVKTGILGVSAQTLEENGAVSEETVKQMAEGVRKKLNTDIGISTSGIAGPDGGTVEKPVGTVWIGYSDKYKTVAKKFIFGSNRENNIKLSAVNALNFLRHNL